MDSAQRSIMSVRAFRRLLRNTFLPRSTSTIRRRNAVQRPHVLALESRINPAVPLQFFYIPMPETQVNAAFDSIITTKTMSQVQDSITAITVTENSTTIWYDQWEDGYEAKLGNPQQSTTQIWGDGKDSNGIAPGFSKDPTGLASGTVIRLRNNVTLPRNTTTQPVLFDSPDRFGADRTLAVSRAQFPTLVNNAGGSVIASAVEVRDTRFYDTAFTAPVGVNTANATGTGSASSMFSYAAFFVQAQIDNTRVQIDANNDGDFADTDDRDVVLNQGQTVVSGATVKQGGRVIASLPVQADLLTGEIGGEYDSRTYALFSNNQAANDYFTPVSYGDTGDSNSQDDVRLYVFNPGTSAISVTQQSKAGIADITKSIPAGSSNYFDVTALTGTRLFSTGKEEFFALGVHDGPGNNSTTSTHDWGFSLQPTPSLSQFAIVGLGVGNSTNPPAGDPNTSPVWVTVLADTTLSVDFDNDGSVDQTIPMLKLQSVRLRDTSDNDNSGMRIFTSDGTLISVAWGEDGTAPDGSPGFDAGTTVPALPVPEYFKFSDFAPGGDVNNDGLFNEGDTIRYFLRIRNIGTTPISNVAIYDFLPTLQVTYVPNTTMLTIGAGTPTPIPDDTSPATPFPLDVGGTNIANIAAAQEVVISFDSKINTGLPAGYNQILNQSVLVYSIYEIPANDVIDLRGSIGDRVWYDVNGDGVQDAGEPGIVGATVSVTWLGTDGVSGGGDDKTFNATAGTNGIWNLTNLPAGNYTTGVAGQPFGLTSKTFGPATFSLISGQVVRTDIDFGYRGSGSIAGAVYTDGNNNAVQNAGELGIPNAKVIITGTDAAGINVNRSVTTDANGKFSFDGLLAGTFSITETQPAGYLDGKDTKGSAGGSLAVNDTFSGIVLANGTNATDYLFGELLPGKLSGTVYHDVNTNGTFDAGDKGIVGVTVTLTGTDDLGANVNIPIFTDTNGLFSFTDIRPGTYTIQETQPATYLDGTDLLGNAGGTLANDKASGIVIASGTTGSGYSFGELRPTVSGKLFIDVNRDGVIQAGDLGKAGVTITLSNGLTTTTDALGNYSFANVLPGSYTVSYTPPTGFGTSTLTSLIANASTANATGINFGITLSTLAGTVYRDDDNSGAQNGAEPGISGVTVTLTDSLGNPVLDGYSNPIIAQSTNGTGAYTFDNILAGNYKVIETQPANYISAINTVGMFNGATTGTVTGDTFTVSIPTGQDGTAYNFGERFAPATVSGFVYNDSDNDGLRALTGEPGIFNASITLNGVDDLGNIVNLTTTTDNTGFYQFTNLRPSNGSGYKVTETQPAGYLDGKDTRGNGTPLAGSGATDFINTISVNVGQTAAENNFGELLPALLSGAVFRDDNNDGTQNGVEPGLIGVTINLTGTDDLGNAVGISQNTVALGVFSFGNLRPGTYKLAEVQPAAYGDGIDTVGKAGGTLANDQVSAIALRQGLDGTGYTFGERGATLSGRVYLDSNNDGLVAGETGILGATVELRDNAGTLISSTTTAADGSYSFPGLPAGNYKVTQLQPAGFLDGKDTPGNSGGVAGVIGTDTLGTVAVTAGAAATGYNFGELQAATIAGIVYHDVNASGGFNTGDIALVNVTVTLTGSNDLGTITPVPVQTNGKGLYTFGNLRPGNYTVTESQPIPYPQGTNTLGSISNTVAGQTFNGGTSVPASDQFTTVTVASGNSGSGYNFGELGTTISGKLFIDVSRDGLIQAGDVGKAGATISLSNGATTVTDTNGNYTITNVIPGSYTVSVAAPAGFGTSTATSTLANASAGNSTGNNFGITLSTIAGTVYRDDDNDGVQDAGEPGIGAVTVNLFDSAGQPVLDGYGNAITTTTTSSSGDYSFTGIVGGDYTIVETQPSAFSQGINTVGKFNGVINGTVAADTFSVSIPAGKDGTAYNFGERGAGLSGTVFIDVNQDGSIQAGDVGKSGVTITVTDGNVNFNPVTQADGSYSIANLPAGTYTVTLTVPNGFGTSTVTSKSVFVPAAGSTGNDFGITLASLAGSVYRDDDNNGTQNGAEPGLGGVTVTLLDNAGNPVLDGFGIAVTATKTNASGAYVFNSLLLGDYKVVETQPAAYNQGINTVGKINGIITGGVVGDTFNVNVPAGKNGTGYNFGERGTTLAGLVFVDTDASGTFQAGEPGKSGVTVTITDSTTAFTPVTLADGTYSVANLPAGTYSVTITVPTGFGTSTVTTKNIVVSLAGSSGNNFGLTLAKLGGTVFRDDDNNGAQNGVEPGIGGVSITITDNTGNPVLDGFGVTVGPVMTALDGTYQFTGLPTGTYKIAESPPAGYLDGKDALGNSGGTLANDSVSGINITAGGVAAGYNFGELLPATVAGTVFQDNTNDGFQNNGEPGLVGVTVTLTGTDDLGAPVSLSQQTDAKGNYSFGNIRPGLYVLVESQPGGLLDGKDNAGTSAGTLTDDKVSAVTVSSGASIGGITFGELPAASLKGLVYADVNANNAFDVTDTTLGGVAVTLTGNDDLGNAVNTTVNTQPDGSFIFTNLRPSDAAGYRLTETQPAGYNQGANAPGTIVNVQAGQTTAAGANGPGVDQISGIVLAAGTQGKSYLFGERGAGLSGTVFIDDNRDGVIQAGDTGKGAVTVTVSDGTNTINTATDVNGNFNFGNLLPGDYTVTVTVPTGYGTSTSTTKFAVVGSAGSTGNNFGLTLSTLAGSVYRDDDNSGLQNGAEPGLGGVTVTLTDASGNPVLDGYGNPVVATTTAADGSYAFTGLLGTSYKVIETQPAAYSQGKNTVGAFNNVTTGTVAGDTFSVVVPVGKDGSGYSFGERGAVLAGTVYIDANQNGTIQTGDVGKTGVIVTVTDGTNTFNVTTQPDGTYSVPNLPAGTYTVTVTVPTGFGTSTATSTMINVPTTGSSGIDFGLTLSSLAGTVYRDDDNSGTQNGTEPGLSGVTVTLTDAAGNPVLDGYGNPIGAMITDSAGAYSFAGMLNGIYNVVETQPSAYSQGTNTVGVFNGTPTGTVSGDTFSVGVPAGKTGTGYNFGERGAGLTGLVFIDANQDGAIQGGDVGKVGVTVTVSDGTTKNTVFTQSDGTFNVPNLPAGQYTITINVPTGFGTSTPVSKIITVGTNGSANNNFGLTLSSFAGTVFRDDDNSGIQNAGEPGLGGVTISLVDDLGNPVLDGYGNPVSSAITSATGAYQFTGLLGGNYKVIETQPAGLQQGINTVGSFNGTPTGTVAGDTFSVSVPAGKTGTGYNFAERGTGTIGDRVWFDVDNNGKQDAGEPGLNGVTVSLVEAGTDGKLSTADDVNYGTMTTAGDGKYTFTNIPTGIFAVTVASGLPAGLTTPTADLDGTGTPNSAAVLLTVATSTRDDLDFGYRGTGVVGDLIWNDQNGDGVQNNSEPGLPNIPVVVTWFGPDSQPGGGDDVSISTFTDANGGYSVGNLPAGPFSIAVNGLPANVTLTTPAPGGFTLAAGEVRNSLDYGYKGNSGIGDFVWYDVDGNGTQNNAEPGIGNVNLSVVWAGTDNSFGTTDDVIYSTATATNGKWSVSGLPQGQYKTTVLAGSLPAGYSARTVDLDGVGTPDSAVFSLSAAQSRTDVDFGYRGTGLLSGLATEDLNGNGTRDPLETALGGVTVTLVDGVGNVLATTTTTSIGTYSFPGLAPGSYGVIYAAPTGYTFTVADIGSDVTDSDANSATGKTATVVLPNGGTANFDVGLYRTVTVGDRVFTDTNGNGVQDGGEAGLNGVTVTLFDSKGATVATTTSAGGGLYAFTGVAPGMYTVGFTAPSGFIFTAQNQGGDDAADSDANTVGVTGTITVISGVPDNSIDAGLFQTAGLSGIVWVDQNGDGTQNSNEPGIPGVTVSATGAGPDGKFGTTDDVTLTPTVTGPGGSYVFTGVAPGQFKVSVVTATLPAGLTVPTFDTDGTATPNTTVVTLPSSGLLTNVDYGNQGNGSIGDLVWYNPNGNDTLDAGENGLGGVTINLDWAGPDGNISTTADNLTLSTKTALNGSYSFGALPAGPYRITVDSAAVLPGLAANTDLDGTATPNAALLSLAAAQTRTDADFGYGGTASIGGTVFVDVNADGSPPGDPGLPSVTITVTGTDLFGNQVSVTVISGPDGKFSVPNLAPGQYTVTQTQPPGYGSSTPNIVPVTVLPNSASNTVFGETLGSLSGTVYTDVNVNGAFNPGTDTGFAGVTLTLTGTDVIGNSITRTTTTATDGTYSFSGLLAGTYTIIETQPAGVYDGINVAGTLNGTVGSNAVSAITVGPGVNGTGYLFGEFPPAGAFGFVYNDANANGVRDAGEAGIPGITVTISGTSFVGTPAATPLAPVSMTTDATGRYEFNPLPPGSYTITQTQPAGYLDGFEEAASPNGVTVGNDRFDNVVIAGLPSRGAFNFGEFLPANASGTVILDVNADGIPDANSTGLGDITVTLTGTNIYNQLVTLTTVTAVNGTYSFPGLIPGSYTVTFTPPPYFAVVGQSTIPNVNLTPGSSIGNLLFVVVPNPRQVPLSPTTVYNLPPVVIRQMDPDEISKRMFLSTTPSAVPEDLSGLPQNPQFANTAVAAGGRTDGRSTPIYVAASADSGLPPEVRVFDYATGTQVGRFMAYDPAFIGGVRVTVADIDGDSVDEIITAPGRGGGPLVRVFRADGTLLNQMLPYDAAFRGGLWIAAGDTDGDGKAEIVTGTDIGGGPHVKIVNGLTGADRGSWFAYDPSFRGGVRVAVGDLDGDGKGEIVTAAGIGGGPHVQVFDPVSRKSLRSFFAFDSALRGGTYISTGDTDGDGIDEILVGAGSGGAPQVRVFDGSTFAALASFFAGNTAARNGIRVAAADINADGRDDIVTGAGEGGASEVRVYDSRTPTLLEDFFAFNPSLRGGVFVG